MAWCGTVDAGRTWYTALGHEPYLYLLPEFRQHLLGGILTAVGRLEADCRPAPAGGPSGTGEPSPAPAAADASESVASAQLPVTGPAALGAGGLVALLLAVALRRLHARG
jgi:hypothetical protein